MSQNEPHCQPQSIPKGGGNLAKRHGHLSADSERLDRQAVEQGEQTMVSAFDAQQIAEVEDLFAMFDKNANGSVDRKEFGPMMKTLGLKLTDKELDMFFNRMDESGDGNLEFAEFVLFLEGVARPITLEEELTEAFRFFDEEEDVPKTLAQQRAMVLSARALHKILMGMGEDISESECADMISAATGGLDEIDFASFQRFVQPGNRGRSGSPPIPRREVRLGSRPAR
mmetsp:Transcript_81594/g.214191  ORF Transcript_81594/g.214191 Transcript_81594/m.214191 type:complete len:227 (-) Transcript_81594:202-882(-)